MTKRKYKYHHIGLITDKPNTNHEYNPELKYYASGYYESLYGIELLRFEEDSPLPELIKKIPHIVFEVDNLQEAIKNKKIIHGPANPVDGVSICFIEENGAPVELMQFDRPEEEIWPNPKKRDLDYHHFGISTKIPQEGEIHLDHLNLSCTDHESNPFGLQWMRYDKDCQLPDLVKNVSHVAFKVDNLIEEIKDKDVIIQPNSPSEGVLVAFIQENGIPIELLQID